MIPRNRRSIDHLMALHRFTFCTDSSTVLIVLMLVEGITVEGTGRAMHHRHVGAPRRRRRRRIRRRRQQRRTLKTNGQWKGRWGAEAHRVPATFRHRAIPRRPR